MGSRQQNSGTVRTIKDRKTGAIVGYQALLPVELSSKPESSTDSRYREPLGPMQTSEEGAHRLLRAAIEELLDKRMLRHGLPLESYLQQEIKERHAEARREHRSEARANKLVSTWRSIHKTWLAKLTFMAWPPNRISIDDLQGFFDKIALAENKRTHEPLSGNFIRNVAALLRAAFDRAKVLPNPVDSLRLPKKNRPRVPHLELDAQFRFFGCEEIELRDRVMAGWAMGAGLRVNELLAIELRDVHAYDADPHLTVRFGGRDGAPTKSKRARRVELVEPGLGFVRLYLERFHGGAGGRMFTGERDGYLKTWPESFSIWGASAEIDGLTSHYMRHSYAVSMLSGSWGYDPMSLEFVQKQLGHADITTTERYYGAFAVGVWTREARRITGREVREPAASRPLVTAAALLNLGASGGVQTPELPEEAEEMQDPRHSPRLEETPRNRPLKAKSGALTHRTENAPPSAVESRDEGRSFSSGSASLAHGAAAWSIGLAFRGLVKTAGASASKRRRA